AGGNALGQGNRANLTVGRALQLVGRNVGGGRPGVEDRATHGQMGKLASCFAERLDESAPWPGLAQDRGVPPSETGITLMATEGPRVIVDQLAREPDGLCASLALALESVAHPKQRLAFDALGVRRDRLGAGYRVGGAMALDGLEILDPSAERGPAGRPLAERPPAGRTIALMDIRKPRGDVFLDELEGLLTERGYAVARTMKPTFTKPAP